MPAIRAETRLVALQRLQRRTEHELESARRRDDRLAVRRLEDLAGRIEIAVETEQAALRTSTPRREPVLERMAELGVVAKQVRAWALEAGLTKATRGRLSAELVESYAAAHPSPHHDARSLPTS